MMDTWDSRYPFPADEVNLFALLHNKATKFPAPSTIKSEELGEELRGSDFAKTDYDTVVEEEEDGDIINLKLILNSLKSSFDCSQRLLRHLDLLLEAHKQLSLALPHNDASASDVAVASTPVSPKTDELEGQLKRIQERISHLESIKQARSFLTSCSIPSVASSNLFSHSLAILIENADPNDEGLILKCHRLMEKCWENALVAMERVLDRDLVSLEAYLDDPVYKDLRNLVLKPLSIKPSTIIPNTLIEHFASSYAQLRINFLRYVLDERLNSQFDSFKPSEQILHLIERTRLIMTIEKREFSEIFPENDHQQSLRAQLNKILESVGNLLLQRIEPLCQQSLETEKVVGFVFPLMNSILSKDPVDPFGLFLKLLTENYIKSPINTATDTEKATSTINNDITTILNSNVLNV